MINRTFKLSVLFGFYWMTSCVVYSYTERFLLYYGFRTDEIGLVLAAAYLLGMLLQPLLSQAADRERRVTLKSGICVSAAACVVLGALTLFSARVLPLFAALFGAMTCVTLAMQPLINAVGFHYLNRGESLDLSFARGVGSVAYALASLLLGALAERHVDWLLWFYLAANAGLLLTALRFAPHRTECRDAVPVGNVFSLIRKYPRLLLFCLGTLVLNVPHMFINSYLASITAVTGGEMSVMIAIAAIVEFPAMIAYSHVRKRTGDRPLLLFSAAVYLLKTGLLLLAAATSVGPWAVYASFVLQMFCYAIFTPASLYYANDAVAPADHVKGQMLLTETGLLSGVVSMLFGGLSLSHLGVVPSLLLCEGLVLLGVILVFFAARRPPSDAR